MRRQRSSTPRSTASSVWRSRVDRIEGKWKVSQNRTDANRRSVADGFEAIGDTSMSELVRTGIDRDTPRGAARHQRLTFARNTAIVPVVRYIGRTGLSFFGRRSSHMSMTKTAIIVLSDPRGGEEALGRVFNALATTLQDFKQRQQEVQLVVPGHRHAMDRSCSRSPITRCTRSTKPSRTRSRARRRRAPPSSAPRRMRNETAFR